METSISEHRIHSSIRVLIGPLDDNFPSPLASQNARPEIGHSKSNATRYLKTMHSDKKRTPAASRNTDNTNLQGGRAPITDSITSQYTTDNRNNLEEHTFSSQMESSGPTPDNSATCKSTIPPETCTKNITKLLDIPTTAQYGSSTVNTTNAEQLTRAASSKSRHDNHLSTDRTVYWRKSGPIFIPPLPANHISYIGKRSNYANTAIKHDILLCNQLIYDCTGKQPLVYKQFHTHMSSAKRQDWRQLEVVLTHSALKCYASSGIAWPKRTILYDISLNGEKDSNLSLYLLSPLDYTFCLQFTPTNAKEVLTLVFQARSPTLSQEFYIALYQQLPDCAKKPTPHECKVYIPSINIYVHLPLINLHQPQAHDQQQNDKYDSRYLITMDHIKDAIMGLLENDTDWQAVVGNELGRKDFSLCWIRERRAEWIFWRTSIDGNKMIDMALCPQNIEKYHQLELRPVQHRPRTITLADGTSLQEPHPCEGFLTKISNFEGRRIKTGTWAPRRFYFASFDGYLFVIPYDKVSVPHTRTHIDPKILKHDKKFGFLHRSSTPGDCAEFNNSLVSMVTPFADGSDTIIYSWQQEEINRRMKLIGVAVGCINLTEVSFVRHSSDSHTPTTMPHSTSVHSGDVDIRNIITGSYGSTSSLVASTSESSAHLLEQHEISTSLGSGTHHHGNAQQCGIELVMENGIIIKLEASSSHTCDQWISRLSDLVLYAKARIEAEQELYGDIDNLTPPATDSTIFMGEKGDNDSNAHESSHCCHSAVDTRIWNLCLFMQCRDIAKSGILYIQSKGVFSQKQFILAADGRLHYFNVYKRSGDDGTLIQTGLHHKKGTLDMVNAYVYSGMMSTFDNTSSLQARLNRPPRVFGNGIATNDSDENCLFTIWIPERRRIFSPRRQSIITYHSDRRFHSAGQRWLFMAPSRQDMEEWISAISIIQEKMLRQTNCDAISRSRAT